MKNYLKILAVLIFIYAASCSDSTGPEREPIDNEKPAVPVTATITAEGGTISAGTGDGSDLTLSFPEGAVSESLKLTLTPRPADDGELAVIEFDPAGIQLARPVTISFKASGTDITGFGFSFGSAGNAILLPTEVNTETKTLSTSSLMLGYNESGFTEKKLSGKLPGTEVKGEGSLNVEQIDCNTAISSMIGRLEYARTFPFSSSESAHALISEIIAAQKICGSNLADKIVLEESIEQLEPKVCEGYRDASADAAAIFIEDAETLQKLILPVLGWEATRQVTGVDCDLPAGELTDLLGNMFDQFIDVYTDKINSPDFGEGRYRDIWAEFNNIYNLIADAKLLTLEEAEIKIYDTLLPALLNRLRNNAYQSCLKDNSQQYLADILSDGYVYNHLLNPGPATWANYSLEELKQDIQYCATKMTVTAFDSFEQLESRELQGGSVPGEHISETTLSVPIDEGVLVLQGDIRAFTCLLPDQAVTLGNDELVIKVDGQEVRRLQHNSGRFLTSPVDLHVDEILEKAGLDPETTETFELTMFREGAACDGHYGDGSFSLFSVIANVSAGEVSIEVSPGEVNLSWPETQQFTATVTGTNNHDVIWSATGGTIDSQGLYNAPGVNSGTYTVTAHSVAAPLSRSEATVTVSGKSPYSGYYEGERSFSDFDHSLDPQFISFAVMHSISSSGIEFLGGDNLFFDIRLAFNGIRVGMQCGVDREDQSFGPCTMTGPSYPYAFSFEGTFENNTITGSGTIGRSNERFEFKADRVSDCIPYPVNSGRWGLPGCQ